MVPDDRVGAMIVLAEMMVFAIVLAVIAPPTIDTLFRIPWLTLMPCGTTLPYWSVYPTAAQEPIRFPGPAVGEYKRMAALGPSMTMRVKNCEDQPIRPPCSRIRLRG